MKTKVLAIALAILLISPELARAVCDAYDQTYRYKSAIFYVSNARRIRVTVYNSMQDRYSRCYTAWIKVGGNYVNLDGLPYSPSNWQQAWARTAPSCYGSGYRVVEGYSASTEYDLTRYVLGGYTGEVEVRVSSDCYEVAQVDPCFCWTAKVEVIESYQPTQCNTIVTVSVSPSTIYQGDYITISGRVTSSVSPLVDPEVRLYLDGNFIATTYTDSYGYYSYSYRTSPSIFLGSHTIKAVSKIDSCTEGFATATFNVISLPPSVQYCYLDIYVRDQYGSPLDASIFVDSNYLTYASHVMTQVQAGSHVVSASKSGYNTASKSVSCSCGETKRVDLVLTPTQVCTPGEIRNRYCACSTQVAYEICKADGSGWKTVIENCPSGYVCQGGYCVKVTTTTLPSCQEGYLDEFRCSGNWVQRKYLYSDCSTGWINWKYCSYGCSSGSCISPSCQEGYLDNFRCSGSWIQREYRYSDCSTNWINWKYCEYGCSGGTCLSTEKPCKISLSVSTPSNVLIGDSITSSVKITNSGDVGGYVSFDAYVCKTDPYCMQMTCDGSIDPTVYVPAHETRTLTCTARVQEAGSYEVKVSYSGCDQSGSVYSGVFSVKEKEAKCVAEFLNEFKCDGNWRLQLYRYSDCSTAWVYVENCAGGCCNGKCLTTTTLPAEGVEEKEKLPITGLIVWSDSLTFALLLLILFIIVLIIIWLWENGKFERKQEAEWFGKDC